MDYTTPFPCLLREIFADRCYLKDFKMLFVCLLQDFTGIFHITVHATGYLPPDIEVGGR